MRTRHKVAGGAAVSAAVISLAAAVIQPWEGRELRAYRDIVGVWTICDGDTANVRPGQVATEAECDTRLARQVQTHATGLQACLTRALPVKTEAAFVSWTYNVGVGAACKSTLVRKVNAGDLRGACNELLKWN
ncbi:MAG: hypothetical protein RL268_860, partial [Pseudomonadota bacterium]